MLEKNIQNFVFEIFFGKKDLKEFEKYIYSLSLEEGEKIFSSEKFLKLLEYNYEFGITFEFEKIFFDIIDFDEFFVEYLIFLMENFLKKEENFFEIFDLLYDYYCGGFCFLEPFDRYMRYQDLFFEDDKDHEIILWVEKQIPKIISDLKNKKYKNLYFDDWYENDKNRIIESSILTSRNHRFTYDD